MVRRLLNIITLILQGPVTHHRAHLQQNVPTVMSPNTDIPRGEAATPQEQEHIPLGLAPIPQEQELIPQGLETNQLGHLQQNVPTVTSPNTDIPQGEAATPQGLVVIPQGLAPIPLEQELIPLGLETNQLGHLQPTEFWIMMTTLRLMP